LASPKTLSDFAVSLRSRFRSKNRFGLSRFPFQLRVFRGAAMGKLDGKVALVTGGNRGIGQAIARGLAREGAAVVLAARDAVRLAAAAALVREGAAAPDRVLAVPADVTDEAQVENLFARAMERFGRLDVLVNNAGAFDGGPLDELTLETWETVIAVNLRGPFL